MPSFETLPNEVLLQIVSCIDSTRDLAALSAQSRTLSTICDMSLRKRYRRIRICSDRDSDKAFHMLVSILRRPILGKYVRHIKFDWIPGRQDFTTRNYSRMEIKGDDQERLSAAVRRAGFTGEEEEKVLDLVRMQAEGLYGKGFSGGTQRGRGYDHDPAALMAQAIAALLISVSPNLESMEYTPFAHYVHKVFVEMKKKRDPDYKLPFYPLATFFKNASHANPNEIPYLRNLTTVKLIHNKRGLMYFDDMYVEYNMLGNVKHVRGLPAIESVSVDIVANDHNNGDPDIEPRSSNITKFRITHSNLCAESLVKLIRSSKQLKEFTYSVGGRSSLEGGHAAVYPCLLAKALLRHRGVLEVLDLDVEGEIYDVYEHPWQRGEEEEDWWNDDDDDNVVADGNDDAAPGESRSSRDLSIGSLVHQPNDCLKAFNKMTRLSIGVRFLIYLARGIDQPAMNEEDDSEEDTFTLINTLPPNLEYLCLRGYEKGENWKRDWLVSELVQAQKDGKLPRLKEIVGVDKCIPNSCTIQWHNDGEIWKGEEVEQWTDYEI